MNRAACTCGHVRHLRNRYGWRVNPTRTYWVGLGMGLMPCIPVVVYLAARTFS